jgi:hypothetical protein
MLILNVCLTMCMHGLYTSTQHLDETLELLNWTIGYAPLVMMSTLASAHMFCIMSHVTSVNIRHSSHTLIPHFIYSYPAMVFTLLFLVDALKDYARLSISRL